MAHGKAKIMKIGGGFGIAAIIVYVACSLAAASHYPGHFDPFANWISDLGSYEKNPSGAVIYNVGAGIAGLLLFPFFTGLASWYYLAKNNKYLYVGTEIFGFVAALGMIMHGVFQEGTSLHFLWASVCFGALVLVMVLANTALLKNPKFYKPLGYYGYAAAIFGLLFSALFVGIKDTPKIMEWIAAYSGFLWVWLFSLNALHRGHGGHRGHRLRKT